MTCLYYKEPVLVIGTINFTTQLLPFQIRLLEGVHSILDFLNNKLNNKQKIDKILTIYKFLVLYYELLLETKLYLWHVLYSGKYTKMRNKNLFSKKWQDKC